MLPPSRLTVPTCIGCGAMGRPGTCAATCSEQKLELVRAAAYDELMTAAADAGAQAEAFAGFAHRLATSETSESAYKSAQREARELLRRYPEGDATAIADPSEHATTWWCPECGGIDAPQPCLGICVWREVEWVRRSRYDAERERALTDHAREQALRRLLRELAWVTPRPDQWDRAWERVRARLGPLNAAASDAP